MTFLLLFIYLHFILSTPVSAQSITPSPSTDKVEDVKDILKQIVKETSINDSASESTISKQPKSFFGTITQVDADQIKITLKDQNSKTLSITQDTTFVNSRKQKGKISDFKSGQTIIAMGYLKEDQSLDCRRIVYTESKAIENINQIVTGQIVDVSQSQNSPIFVLIPSKNKNSQYQIKTDSKTEIVDLKNTKSTSNKTIVTSKKIIAIIQPDTKLVNTFYATKIIDLSIETASSP
jgi:Cu/Ag efflux protein CusF